MLISTEGDRAKAGNPFAWAQSRAHKPRRVVQPPKLAPVIVEIFPLDLLKSKLAELAGGERERFIFDLTVLFNASVDRLSAMRDELRLERNRLDHARTELQRLAGAIVDTGQDADLLSVENERKSREILRLQAAMEAQADCFDPFAEVPSAHFYRRLAQDMTEGLGEVQEFLADRVDRLGAMNDEELRAFAKRMLETADTLLEYRDNCMAFALDREANRRA